MSAAFFDPATHNFLRVGVCTPRVRPADVSANGAETERLIQEGAAAGCSVLLFPELGLSAYAIDDLLLQAALLEAVESEIGRLAAATKRLDVLVALGAPVRVGDRLYNAAVLLHRGRVLGVVPKSFLPNYREFYERRWFTPGADVVDGATTLAGQTVPFGADLLFHAEGPVAFTAHVEICEDVWTPQPPSGRAALSGAEVLLNLSASNITIGKAEMRRLLCGSQSARCLAAYAYSAAGPGESTTDLAWDGHAAVFELGERLAETGRFPVDSALIIADVDLDRIRAERLRTSSFADAAKAELARNDGRPAFRIVAFQQAPPPAEDRGPIARVIERYPYVPSDPHALYANCHEAWNIQVQGLTERLRSTGLSKLVIGVSGGLDSTQALIVAVKAMDRLGHPRGNVLAYTLPGFATSDATKSSAWALMRGLGVSAEELDIRPLAQQMLNDLGHPAADGAPVYDITYENVQAGLRTDLLFRLANQHGGLVVGTGDLSELGLGWATYGVGDQMSHYNPNVGVSKTLIQHLIRFAADHGGFGDAVAQTLKTVLATEISPELIPAADGVGQSTEASVGPYALQDFNLFYLTRYGFKPSKIAFLAWTAWSDSSLGHWPPGIAQGERRAYDLPTIKHWMSLFLKRFFSNQFKRSALPNGPKISSGGSLSPRGDWRMPSDAVAAVWLSELEANVPDQAGQGANSANRVSDQTCAETNN
jgi:NAD+ synthase (glutamine-hydrolysing)